MINRQKAQRIDQALNDFLKQAPQTDQSIVGEKRALRDAISGAVKGTSSEQWGTRAKDDYAPWSPAREVDIEGIKKLSADIEDSPDEELHHLFKQWNLEQDLGL